MRTQSARLALAASVVLATSVALLAGCGDASGHARPEVPQPFDGAAHIPAADGKLFVMAEEELVAACMRGRGMAYLKERPAPDGGVSGDGAAIYGLVSPQDARLHGYGMGERLLPAPSSSGDASSGGASSGGASSGGASSGGASAAPSGANDAARAAMTDEQRRAWEAALLGTPGQEEQIEVDGSVFTYRPDACVTLARQELFGKDWDRLRLTAQVAVNTVVTQVWRDAGVTAAVGRWSHCMAGKGRDFESPAQPRAAVDRALAAVAAGDRAAFSAALRLEHETAIADADCQRESGLWDAVGTAQATVERAIPPAFSAALSSFRAARETAVVAARRIVDTAPTERPTP